jgi:hypothetical protein
VKFRAKFEKWNGAGIALVTLFVALELYDRHASTAFKAYIVSCWGLAILLNLSTWLFCRLELDASHLRRRGLFRTKEVSLAEITRVRNLGFTTGQLVIEFTPSKAQPDSIVVDPKDRSGFISAMRRFAPKATFE